MSDNDPNIWKAIHHMGEHGGPSRVVMFELQQAVLEVAELERVTLNEVLTDEWWYPVVIIRYRHRVDPVHKACPKPLAN
jgi:hypothetical protein